MDTRPGAGPTREEHINAYLEFAGVSACPHPVPPTVAHEPRRLFGARKWHHPLRLLVPWDLKEPQPSGRGNSEIQNSNVTVVHFAFIFLVLALEVFLASFL